MLKPIAANSIPASTIPVMFGVVSSTLLNKASNRKEIFCIQIFRNARGQRRLSHFGFLSGGASIAPRWSHSPGRGIGQTAHHPRPKEEWIKLFRKSFKFMGGEVVGEFLMSIGYLPGAHADDCPVHRRILQLGPPWREGPGQ